MVFDDIRQSFAAFRTLGRPRFKDHFMSSLQTVSGQNQVFSISFSEFMRKASVGQASFKETRDVAILFYQSAADAGMSLGSLPNSEDCALAFRLVCTHAQTAKELRSECKDRGIIPNPAA